MIKNQITSTNIISLFNSTGIFQKIIYFTLAKKKKKSLMYINISYMEQIHFYCTQSKSAMTTAGTFKTLNISI